MSKKKANAEPSINPKRRDAVQTRNRLLEAAGLEFAEHGYKGASVRTICHRAGANVAAIRHYFGSKNSLYREVILSSHRELFHREPVPRFEPNADPAEAFERWIMYMLRLLLVRRADHPYAGQLFARELQAPTEALDDLVQTIVRPVRMELERIISALLGDADNPKARGYCANFVMGQIAVHELAREVFSRFGYPSPKQDAGVARLGKRLVPFLLGGIERTRMELEARPNGSSSA